MGDLAPASNFCRVLGGRQDGRGQRVLVEDLLLTGPSHRNVVLVFPSTDCRCWTRMGLQTR